MGVVLYKEAVDVLDVLQAVGTYCDHPVIVDTLTLDEIVPVVIHVFELFA